MKNPILAITVQSWMDNKNNINDSNNKDKKHDDFNVSFGNLNAKFMQLILLLLLLFISWIWVSKSYLH